MSKDSPTFLLAKEKKTSELSFSITKTIIFFIRQVLSLLDNTFTLSKSKQILLYEYTILESFIKEL